MLVIDNFTSTSATNQATLNATEGATALKLIMLLMKIKLFNKNQNKKKLKKSQSMNPLLENISIENATYLQNLENMNEAKDSELNDDIPEF